MILKIIIHSQCRVTRSLDHLVGAQQNRRRQLDADGLRGPQIHGELESVGLLETRYCGVSQVCDPPENRFDMSNAPPGGRGVWQPSQAMTALTR
jgi:hypothetical protein